MATRGQKNSKFTKKQLPVLESLENEPEFMQKILNFS